MSLLFLVDDNRNLIDSLSEYLRLHDFDIRSFLSGEGVVEAFIEEQPDLVVLDIMLPRGDGFLLAKEIRKISSVPIVFLTARESELDRITGFELGADDYVVKPFSMKEFVLRIKALLRRINYQRKPLINDRDQSEWHLNGNILVFDDLTHQLTVDDRSVTLTLGEWKILKFLLLKNNAVCSREEIVGQGLCSSGEGYGRLADTHVKNIRSKLGNSEWIETIRGEGYRFRGVRNVPAPVS